jgi:N-acetylglucosaminyldiphosphoundecaprenol N-acetyl-beta-D-mannosaminyltransferase
MPRSELPIWEDDMRRIRLGSIFADYVTQKAAVDMIIDRARLRKGGYVVTPNVDHVVIAENDDRLRAAYAGAMLSLVDGMPLIWASKLLGARLPEKISGSDLVKPLLRAASEAGLRVYLLGAAPGVGQKAAQRLVGEIPGLAIAGVDSPPIGFDQDAGKERATIEKMLAAKPDIALVALGCPKQELLMSRWCDMGICPVMIGIGASLDFIAGTVKRAPKWMSSIGLEWVFRIIQDPNRLAKRYLIQDMRIVGIFIRMLGIPRDMRFYTSD